MNEIELQLPAPHAFQRQILDFTKKRIVVRAGRRGGKITVSAMLATKIFCEGKRVLYVAPTQDQVDAFWRETKRYLRPAFAPTGPVIKTESNFTLELPGHKARIEAVSNYNPNSLRGRYCDLLILDE